MARKLQAAATGKLLDIFIAGKLSFDTHIKFLRKKSRETLDALARVSIYLTLN